MLPDWLRRWLPTSRAPGQLNPESCWSVAAADDVLTVTDAGGQERRLAFADLIGVAIETNDSGPWGADLWWLLFGQDGKLAVTWPQGATGGTSVIDRLTAIPGFDHQQMIAAMASTKNATFILWSRATAE
ncbi:MAG: hypothetical protein JWM65_2603 [Sphingomonas bacterium]|nr:hypothetical protein [Sphingomonas bacterium]